MAALCSLSEHCESEIREKLRKAAMPASDIEDIVDRLYDEGFLDTARYCRAYARDKLRFDHWGSMKIQQALRLKGLPDADISKALADLYEELGDDYHRILRIHSSRKRAHCPPPPTTSMPNTSVAANLSASLPAGASPSTKSSRNLRIEN